MEDLSRREVRDLARLTEHLTASQQVYFQDAYWRLRRNPTTALVLCLLLGNFGAHSFYFGRYRDAVLRLLFCWTLLPWVVALFEARTIPSQAMRSNAALARELLAALQGEAGDASARSDLAAAVTSAGEGAEAEARQTATTLPRAAEIVGAGAIAAALASVAQRSAREEVEPSVAVDTPVTGPRDGDADEDLVIAAAWRGREAADEEQREAPAATHGDTTAQYYLPASSTGAEEAELPRLRAAPQTVPLAQVDEIVTADPWPRPVGALAASQAEPLAADFVSQTQRTNEAVDTVWPSGPSLGATTALRRAAGAWDGDSAASGAGHADHATPLGTGENPMPMVGWVGDAAESSSVAASGTPLPASDVDQGDDDEGWYAVLPSPSGETATEEREPVFMYQLSAQAPRDSVRLGPAPLTPDDDARAESVDDASSFDGAEAGNGPDQEVLHVPPTTAGGTPDISLLGPALASGLADLLRDRPSRTRPRTADEWAMASNATIIAPLAPLSQPQLRPARAENVTDTADTWGSWEPAPDALSPLGATFDDEDLPSQMPTVVPQQLEQAFNGIRESTSMAPTAAYVTTPSQHVRRRVVQRVIVRKMAVLDGRVVAEATVERQVRVVNDDEEMAAHIRDATNQAAREALEHLIAQAPEEALPAIRMQLYALDNASSVSNFQGNGVLTGPGR